MKDSARIESMCKYILSEGHEEEDYLSFCRNNGLSTLDFYNNNHIFVHASVLDSGDTNKAILSFLGWSDSNEVNLDDVLLLGEALDNENLKGLLRSDWEDAILSYIAEEINYPENDQPVTFKKVSDFIKKAKLNLNTVLVLMDLEKSVEDKLKMAYEGNVS